jgi:lysozyme
VDEMNKEQLIQDLISDEGLRTEPYIDTVGKMTIGVGRNLDDNGISQAEAMFMLTNDIEMVETELDARLDWWRGLPDDAQRALCNMTFNIGWPRLSKFEKMLAALKDRDFEEAAAQALASKWATQVGQRAIRIAQLFRYA